MSQEKQETGEVIFRFQYLDNEGNNNKIKQWVFSLLLVGLKKYVSEKLKKMDVFSLSPLQCYFLSLKL